MVQVSYPGVYVQEVSSGVRTITSVATSIAAFFGRATKGPIDKAVRILSLSDYERQFGEPFPKSSLATSVEQFFNNGGTDCYVVRLAKDAAKASVTLRSLNVEDVDVLDFTAKAEGLWANTVRMEVDYNTPNPDETFNLRVIQEEGGEVVSTESFTNLSMNTSSARYAPSFINQSSALVEAVLSGALGDTADPTSVYNANTFNGYSSARRPFSDIASTVLTTFNTGFFGNGMTSFQISVNGSNYETVDLSDGGDLAGADHIAIADDIEDRINNYLSGLSPAQSVTCSLDNVANLGFFLTITASTPGVNNVSVRVKRAGSNDISAALMLGVDQGGVEPVRWSNFRPAPTASILPIVGALGDITSLNTITALQQSDITDIIIDGETTNLVGDYSVITTAPGDRWYQNAAGESDGVREKLRIIAKAVNDNPNVSHKAEVWGYHLAIIATEGTINNEPTISTTVADLGNEITLNVRQYTLGIGGSGIFSFNGTDGDDGDAPEYSDYIGSESTQTGFYALDAVDLFNLMILPEDEEVNEPTMLSLWGPASTYCEGKRAFLLVDSPASWTDSNGRPAVVNDTGMINDLRISIVKDYSAVFYPHLKYSDNGVTKVIAPAGAIAGLMARTDASRGIWKAPAGIEATIKNVLGTNVELTDAENGVLNKKGSNCIRVFPNGIVNWGSRTLDGDDDSPSEWKYIPVRRLALMIEETLFRGTKWVVFEPNDEPLWAKIRLNIGTYMMSLFRQGAFQGTNPKDAFFVKCDKETTTQDDINKGIVNIRVGFAPLKPAEFVVITIQQMAGEL